MMKNQNNDPANPAEELFRELLSKTGSRRKHANLANVWKALEHLRGLRVKDFSVASVGRTVAALDLGSPKTQSIRNSEGKDYRDLISAFAAQFGETREIRSTSPAEDLVASIEDPKTAAQVKLLTSENTALKRRLDLLKNAYSRLKPLSEFRVDSSDEATPATLAQPLSAPALGRLPDDEVGAIRWFLENVPEMDWTVDEATGAILDMRGREVAPPYFVHALRKLVPDDRGE
jgi:hypothetical protein